MNAVLEVYFGRLNKETTVVRPLLNDLETPAGDTAIIHQEFNKSRVYIHDKAFEKLREESTINPFMVKYYHDEKYDNGPTVLVQVFNKIIKNSGFYDDVDETTKITLEKFNNDDTATITVVVPRASKKIEEGWF